MNKKEWIEKYVIEIKEAVEYSAVTDNVDKIRQTINKIYDDGYIDGVADSESETCEPMYDWHELD